MKPIVAALAVSLAALSAAASARADDAPLDRAGVLAVVERVRNFHKADEFSPALDQSTWAGRAFRVTAPFVRRFSSGSVGLTGWEYDAESQRLKLEISAGIWNDVAFPRSVGDGRMRLAASRGVVVESKTLSRSSHAATNGFGAAVTVTDIERQSAALLFRSGVMPPRDDFVSEVPMAPGKARDVTKGLRLEIDGKVEPNRLGDAVECGVDGSSATFDDPISLTDSLCLVNAHVDRLAIVTAGGDVLAEWTAAGR